MPARGARLRPLECAVYRTCSRMNAVSLVLHAIAIRCRISGERRILYVLHLTSLDRSGLIDGFQQILEGLAIDDDETPAGITDQPRLPQLVEQTGDHLAASADQPAQLLLGNSMTDPDPLWCGLPQICGEFQQHAREPSHCRF